MNNDVLLLIINTLLYWIFFFTHIKKNTFDEIALIIFLWAISSLCSVLYYYTPLYSLDSHLRPITFLPFIFLFTIFFITLLPLYRYKSSKIKYISCSSPLLMPIIYILAFSSFIPMIEIFINLYRNGFSNYLTAYTDTIPDPRAFMSWVGRKLSAISFFSTFITPALIFFYLNSGRRNLFVLVGLFFSYLIYPLVMMNAGSRWAPINGLLYIIYLSFWLRNTVPSRIKKSFLLIFSSGFLFLILIFLIISFGRFGDDIITWLISYTGQSFVIYNQDVWWVTGYTNGEISFNQWVNPDGNILSPGQVEAITGMSVYGAFWTCFGSLQLDYGPVILLIICLIIFLFFFYYSRIKNNSIYLVDLIVISFLGYMLVTGMFYFTLVLSLNTIPITLLFVIILHITSNDKVASLFNKS